MSRVIASIVVPAVAVLFGLLGVAGPARAAAKDDVKITYEAEPIPLQVDAFLVNTGAKVVALVHSETFQGSKKIGENDKEYEVGPGGKVPVGKAKDSLDTTVFTIKAAAYKP